MGQEEVTCQNVASAKTMDEMLELVDYLHDNWFDLAEIDFDQDLDIVTVPFEREFYEDRRVISSGILKTVEAPVYQCALRVRDVSVVEIEDSGEVGRYNFVDLEFDPTLGKLKIQTGIPLDFVLVIRSIDIAIFREIYPSGFTKHKVPFA